VTLATPGKQVFTSVRHSWSLKLTVRDHSFLQNAEFWAEPRNLPTFTEFLCFCGIWYWPAIRGQIWHMLVGFRRT